VKFGNHRGKFPKPNGKGSRQEMLPSRNALAQLTGSPFPRSINDYAKLTPSGANAPPTYGDIMSMAEAGVSAEPEA
jgi:hypothetical protein